MGRPKHKECFINDDTCKGKIKEAHILSRAATMKLICASGKGGLSVIKIATKKGGRYEPEEVGWSKASAYHCFCDVHDTNIFEAIENAHPFEIDNSEQVFLHIFRSFAFSYHKKRSQIDPRHEMAQDIASALKSIIEAMTNLDENNPFSEIEERYSREMLPFYKIRDSLIEIHKSKNYGQVRCLQIVVPFSFPFASAGTLMAEIMPSKSSDNWTVVTPEEGTPFILQPGIMLTILPEKDNKTYILLAALSKDANATMTLDKFDRLAAKSQWRAPVRTSGHANKRSVYR